MAMGWVAEPSSAAPTSLVLTRFTGTAKRLATATPGALEVDDVDEAHTTGARRLDHVHLPEAFVLPATMNSEPPWPLISPVTSITGAV